MMNLFISLSLVWDVRQVFQVCFPVALEWPNEKQITSFYLLISNNSLSVLSIYSVTMK